MASIAGKDNFSKIPLEQILISYQKVQQSVSMSKQIFSKEV